MPLASARSKEGRLVSAEQAAPPAAMPGHAGLKMFYTAAASLAEEIMKILFIHQNFPAQYGRLAEALAKTPGWQVMAMGETANVKRRGKLPQVNIVGYTTPAAATPSTHHYVKPLEAAVRRGQSVARACLELKKRGFVPDIVYAHPGWGEALFIRDAFPQARITLYCEFFYGAQGRDVGFDPEFPASMDDEFRVRIKNAASLLSLDAADGGISPTQWQRGVFPAAYRDRIALAHEGVDTDLICPATGAEVTLAKGVKLTPRDEVVTYIARNLEPYRGFHSFMRALPEILKRRPRAHVLVVGGDGVSYGQSLPKGETYRKKYLAELGKQIDPARVHFLGQISYEQLLQVYRVSTAHIYLTYPFVLSWSLLEAMSAGCTLVASRTAPVEEVITDGENGYLVDFFKPDEIAARVSKVLERPQDTAKVRENARRTVVERYDLKRVCLPQQLALLKA
jgi:glycosyltransferase involved in cell wall biosynthesis